MNEKEQREALMRLSKSVGDAAGGMVLAFVAIAVAIKECGKALESFAATTSKKTCDDADTA